VLCPHPELKNVVADFMRDLDELCCDYSGRLGPKLLRNSLFTFTQDIVNRCSEVIKKED
jgi:hypothetical protein